LKQEALYCPLWRTSRGRGYGPVVSQTGWWWWWWWWASYWVKQQTLE